jgi:hypothetical protein
MDDKKEKGRHEKKDDEVSICLILFQHPVALTHLPLPLMQLKTVHSLS